MTNEEKVELERMGVLLRLRLLDVEGVRAWADRRVLESEVAGEPWLSLATAGSLVEVESLLGEAHAHPGADALAHGVEALGRALEEERVELRRATRSLCELGRAFGRPYEPLWEEGMRLDGALDQVELHVSVARTLDEIRADTVETLRRLPAEIRSGGGR